VSHSAAVFDVEKLAWVNRHYMKEADPDRIAALTLPWFVAAGMVGDGGAEALRAVQSVWPMAIGAVDRLEEVPARVAFVFGWDPVEARRLVAAEPDGTRVVAAFADAVGDQVLTRESFRAAATRAREVTGVKGRALFHPIRVALTGWDSGPELDLAVPAIDQVAAVLADVPNCATRARLSSQ
jgi:nondiscriminating glutamyl-tRNA synthetase